MTTANCHCARRIELETAAGDPVWLHVGTGWAMCDPRETPLMYAAPAIGEDPKENHR